MPILKSRPSRSIAGALLASSCWIALSSSPVLAQTSLSSHYSFVTLDYPGAAITYPLGINNKKEISGYYLDSTYAPHGFVYKKGNFTAIEFPGALSTVAGGINDAGDLSGVYIDQQGFQHGFLLTFPDGCDGDEDGKSWKCRPTYQSLDVPGAVENRIPFEFGPGLGSAAAGLNNRRQVAGLYAAGVYSNGFIFSNGSYRRIDNPAAAHTPGSGTRMFGVNNLGVAVGDYITQAGPTSPPINHGFLLEGDQFKPVYVPGSELGGFGTQANGVNDFQVVVGVFSDSHGLGHGLVWFGGLSFTLDYPAALFSEAHTINDCGDITGAYFTDPTGQTGHGFVASPKL